MPYAFLRFMRDEVMAILCMAFKISFGILKVFYSYIGSMLIGIRYLILIFK